MAKNDDEYTFLRHATGRTGTYNDLYAAYLRGLGYTGTLTDMIGAFKRGPGGTLSPSTGGGWRTVFDNWLDFEAGTSKFPNYSGLTDTWSGGLVQTPTGYNNIAANVLARSALGLQTVPTRTNKCDNRNANPVDLTRTFKSGDASATVSVVDDVAALAAAGLSGICTSGKVYRFDNSAGTGVASLDFLGPTGNTNDHSVSITARGSGTLRLRTGFTAFFNSSWVLTPEYIRRSGTQANGLASGAKNVGDTLRVEITAGSVAYLILNQLEEGPFATPPIVTTGSAVTRTGNRQVIDLTGKLQYGVAGFVKFDLLALANSRPLLIGDDANNHLRLRLVGTTLFFEGVNGGSTTQLSLGSGSGAAGLQTIAFAGGNGFLKAAKVGGSSPAANTSFVLPSMTKLAVGGAGYLAADNTYQLTKKLGLIYGTPDKPINQALFDHVYAQAEAIHNA